MKRLHGKALPLLVFMVVMAGLVQESKGDLTCGRTFFSALIQLVPCRSAVAAFAHFPPSEPCCAAVKSLGQPCLCMLLNGPSISGVDRNMALQLPEKCATNFQPCSLQK